MMDTTSVTALRAGIAYSFTYMSYGLWDVRQIYIIINSFVTVLWAEPIRIIMNKQVV